ncbi:general transcription factor II-I repeat domain-containing protein 2-like [Hydra vulgaris]|uniref:General transcription factor II-I repeat domain-containing protein 2-like n=1 Tax=Hydra vulgaris TaxID=6087 RepID=A0ABM4B9Y4_HYDVU
MNTKKRKVADENRRFNKLWTEKYAVIESDGNPLCLIYSVKLQNNESSNIERHFEGKHKEFAQKYPEGSTTTEVSFALSLQIAKAGKPFTDGEFLKDCMYTVSGILYNDFKNKDLILSKIKDIPLSARTVKERILNIAEEVSNMKNEDIKRADFLSLAIDESVDVTNISQWCVMEALVAKSLGAIPQLKNVMEVIVPIVNFIRAKSLNHRIFTVLLEEMDFIHKELVTFTAVHWLSRRKTLKQFFECLSEITKFLAAKNYNGEHCKLLKISEWLQNFHFLLDMTEHFNKLNLKMQGKGNISAQLLQELITFEQKLQLFLDNISGDQFIYILPSLRNFRMKIISEAEKVDLKQFSEITTTVWNKSIWANKFEAMLAHIAISEENMKDTPQGIIFQCWTSLPNTYINSKKLAYCLLTIFSSMYNCEQFFSSMNFIKNKYRSRLTDESTQALLQLRSTKKSSNPEITLNFISPIIVVINYSLFYLFNIICEFHFMISSK